MTKTLVLSISIIIHVVLISSITIPSVVGDNLKVVNLRLKSMDIINQTLPVSPQIEKKPHIDKKIAPVTELKKTTPDSFQTESNIPATELPVVEEYSTEMSFLVEKESLDNNQILHFDSHLTESVDPPFGYHEPESNHMESAIDTDSIRQDYYQSVLSRIDRNKVYPAAARRSMRSGIVEIGFTIHADGSISDIAVINESEFEPFNTAAMNALMRSTPFPNIPSELNTDNIRVSVDISFEINR